MIFSCDRCGRRYSVPDERVQGRTFRVTCKHCGNVILVQPGAGARPPPPLPPAAPAPTRAAVPERPAAQEAPTVPELPAPAASGRGMSTGELAWMSEAGERVATGDLTLGGDGPGPGGESSAHPERRAPGLPRVLLAAIVLGVVAAGAVALLWPGLRQRPEPARPAVAAANPAPSVPDVEPEPAPQPPAPAVLHPDALAEPAASPEPARAAEPRARFEPGTVTVARVRKKETHTLSRKDRRLLDLLDRKKDGAAPPEPVETLDLDTGRSLDPAAVERVVAESQGAFSGCISRNARPGEAQRATLLLTVDTTGAVSSAWIAEADVSRSGLGRCLATAGRRLAFPSFEGQPVDVSVPLLLEAR